jgi:hypothetical protein
VATLDGQTYHTGLDPPLLFIDFSGAPVVAPPLVGDSASVSAPFVFFGFFTYPVPNPPFPDDYVRVDLSGRGSATISFVRDQGAPDHWRYSAARYEIAPIPEPATLFLLGGGLAALGARAHRGAGRARVRSKPSAAGSRSTTPP